MHTERHPIRRRPIGAILEARRREKAALAARGRAFAAISAALAHYARNPLTPADPVPRGRWEQLGDYAGAAASADGSGLRTASEQLRRTPGREHAHERDVAPARPRADARAGAAP